MNDLDRRLESALRRTASAYVPSDAAAARERFLRRRLRRRVTRATVAALAGAAAAAALVVSQGPPRPRELPVQGVPAAPPGRTAVTATIEVGAAPSDVAVAEAVSTWCPTCDAVVYVAHREGGDIVLIAPDSGRSLGTISPDAGGAPSVVAVGDGALFGADPIAERLARFELIPDDSAEPRARARVGAQPTDVVAGEGYVWVASSALDGPADSYVVTKLDAATLERVSTIPVPGIAHLDFGYGRLWAGTTRGVVAIDPRTDEREPVRGVGSVSDVSAGAGALWAFEQPARGLGGALVRIDPEAAEAVERVPLRGYFARVEADAANGIWVLASLTEQERLLVRIDPRSGRRMGEPLPLQGGVMEMSSGAGHLWLVDDATGDLRRIAVERG